mmetsp:Transcript_2415/g.9364  ORF Transcript_2415/g.9364 Transcript_2415/m.9364 type:complete len:480 (+) Transcript_2415:240-1679(+)
MRENELDSFPVPFPENRSSTFSSRGFVSPSSSRPSAAVACVSASAMFTSAFPKAWSSWSVTTPASILRATSSFICTACLSSASRASAPTQVCVSFRGKDAKKAAHRAAVAYKRAARASLCLLPMLASLDAATAAAIAALPTDELPTYKQWNHPVAHPTRAGEDAANRSRSVLGAHAAPLRDGGLATHCRNSVAAARARARRFGAVICQLASPTLATAWKNPALASASDSESVVISQGRSAFSSRFGSEPPVANATSASLNSPASTPEPSAAPASVAATRSARRYAVAGSYAYSPYPFSPWWLSESCSHSTPRRSRRFARLSASAPSGCLARCRHNARAAGTSTPPLCTPWSLSSSKALLDASLAARFASALAAASAFAASRNGCSAVTGASSMNSAKGRETKECTPRDANSSVRKDPRAAASSGSNPAETCSPFRRVGFPAPRSLVCRRRGGTSGGRNGAPCFAAPASADGDSIPSHIS